MLFDHLFGGNPDFSNVYKFLDSPACFHFLFIGLLNCFKNLENYANVSDNENIIWSEFFITFMICNVLNIPYPM